MQSGEIRMAERQVEKKARQEASSAAPGGGFGPGGYGSYGREPSMPGESRRRADFWSPATSADAADVPAGESGRMREGLTARDVMTQHVLAATPDTPLAEIARMMRDASYALIPVVDDERKLLGVVTDRDLAEALGRAGR
jgi:CBS domain